MSRDLTHYFSCASDDPKKAKVKHVSQCDDGSDFENDDVMPLKNGNSIKRYFSRAEKMFEKAPQKCSVTVQAVVHESPPEHIQTKKSIKIKTKTQKRLGISSRQADLIEVVNTDQVDTQQRVSKTPTSVGTKADIGSELRGDPKRKTETCKNGASTKPEMKSGLSITKPHVVLQPTEENVEPVKQEVTKISQSKTIHPSTVEESLQNLELQSTKESVTDFGPRRSTRIRNKPASLPNDDFCDEEEVVQKKRKKSQVECEVDGDVQCLSDDVAPIFLRKQFKEQVRAMKKAKHEFLHSGVPEVLKQQVSAQQAMEHRPVEIFPLISHVTQSDAVNLRYPEWLTSRLKHVSPFKITRPQIFDSSLNGTGKIAGDERNTSTPILINSQLEWRQCKEWINRLKKDQHINFPFFRTLRSFISKGRNSDLDLWSDVCSTTQWVDNLANSSSIAQLRKWLQLWKRKAGEVVEVSPQKKMQKTKLTSKSRVAGSKRKRVESESSNCSDQVTDDNSNSDWNDSESSSDELSNTMLLVGPAGCGKTASVYALAERLGFNVLEVNASSKRNGKSVLSQLHEATQSHTLRNGHSTSNNFTKFFGQSTPTNEPRSALSLVLFEDVDIVFESEDESFYSALSTLMNTSKRPIVLTLSCERESNAVAVREKIKSYTDVLTYQSPDLPTTCGLLWIWCLVEGYPLDWNTLQDFVTSPARPSARYFDLRYLLHDLQFRLHHHPMRVELNFNQLELKKDEAGIKPAGGLRSKQHSGAATLFIDLKSSSQLNATVEWPRPRLPRSARFIHSEDGGVVPADSKKKFHRIRTADSEDETSVDSSQAAAVQHKAPIDNLSRCLDLRADFDLLSAFRVSSRELSLTAVELFCDMEQFFATKCTGLWQAELRRHQETPPLQCEMCTDQSSHLTDINAKDSTGRLVSDDPNPVKSGRDEALDTLAVNHVLWNAVPNRLKLARSANANDVLPYLRSLCRSDLSRSAEKRRRKSDASKQNLRVSTLDLALPANLVLNLANTF